MSAETTDQTPPAAPKLRIEVEQHTAVIRRLDRDRESRFLVTGSEDKKNSRVRPPHFTIIYLSQSV